MLLKQKASAHQQGNVTHGEPKPQAAAEPGERAGPRTLPGQERPASQGHAEPHTCCGLPRVCSPLHVFRLWIDGSEGAASPECVPHCMFSDCGLTVQRVETHGHCLKWKSTEQKWSRKQSKRNQEVIVLLCKTRFLYWYVYWVRPGYKICLFCRLWEENSSTHTPGSRFLPAGCV